MGATIGLRLGALLAALSLVLACADPAPEEAREEPPVPAPVWARPDADLAVALAPEALRGSPAGRALLPALIDLLREHWPSLAEGLESPEPPGSAPTLLVVSVGGLSEGEPWSETGSVAGAEARGGAETLSAVGPEPIAALVHLRPGRLPPETLAELPAHLRRQVVSLRRAGLALRAGELLALSGRAEAASEADASSLASILRGLAESAGAGARARGDALLAAALGSLRVEHRGPVVILEANLDLEQARALLRSVAPAP